MSAWPVRLRSSLTWRAWPASTSRRYELGQRRGGEVVDEGFVVFEGHVLSCLERTPAGEVLTREDLYGLTE